MADAFTPASDHARELARAATEKAATAEIQRSHRSHTMPEAKHTPGPWRVQASSFCETEFVITGSNRDGGAVLPILGRACNWPKNAEANARLIAAAPDMLAALQSVNKLVSEAAMTGFNCHDGDWAERLFLSQQATSRAIAAAEGR